MAYLFLIRCCANSLIALLIVTGYELVRPCRYAFNASFKRQTVDTPLPAIFAALWIECPPFNKRTMGSQYLNGRNPVPYALPYAPTGVRL